MRFFEALRFRKVFAMKRFALCLAVLSVPAFAGAKAPTPPTHHCVKDGAANEKTKKDCKKEGGKWEKIAAAAPAKAAPAAESDAPAVTK